MSQLHACEDIIFFSRMHLPHSSFLS
uniref:Uncharacterized protein n=1 Tax=Triticum urartu TaxID=4572 RepID=A0A8R7PSW1_TRIUA